MPILPIVPIEPIEPIELFVPAKRMSQLPRNAIQPNSIAQFNAPSIILLPGVPVKVIGVVTLLVY